MRTRRLPAVRRWPEYRRIFNRPRVWAPVVRELLRRHGLAPGPIRGTFPGTATVFAAGRPTRLVKVHPPFHARDAAFEVDVLRHLRRRTRFLVPRVVAAGALADRSRWPYAILAPVPGVAWRVVERRLSPADRLAAMDVVGRWLRTLHTVRWGGTESFAGRARGWDRLRCCRLRAGLRKLTAHGVELAGPRGELVRRLDRLTALPAGRRPVLVHGDLNEDHVLLGRRVGRWRPSGLIDFADAHVADPVYEWPPTWFGLCGRDPGLFRRLLRGYDPAVVIDTSWRDRAAAFTLVYDFGPDMVIAALHGAGLQRASMDWPSFRDWLWPATLDGPPR